MDSVSQAAILTQTVSPGSSAKTTEFAGLREAEVAMKVLQLTIHLQGTILQRMILQEMTHHQTVLPMGMTMKMRMQTRMKMRMLTKAKQTPPSLIPAAHSRS
jgi:hypothetical protein